MKHLNKHWLREKKYRRIYMLLCEIYDDARESELQWYLDNIKFYSFGYRFYGSPPKDFRRFYHKSHRAKEKSAIHNFIYEKRYKEFPDRHRHSAQYDYR